MRKVPLSSVKDDTFNIYINDVCKTSQMLKYNRFNLFADDTNILAAGDNLELLLQSVTSELININKQKKLSLNLNKNKIIIFGNCKSSI